MRGNLRITHDSTLSITEDTGSEASSLGKIGPSQAALVVKSLPASAGDVRDSGSIPGSGRSSGGRHGNPLQYSYLENPMDRGTHGLQSTGSHRVRHN